MPINAQEVRQRRLQKSDVAIEKKVQEFFDCLLGLMDEDTLNGHYNYLFVFLPYNQNEIEVERHHATYSIHDYNSVTFFERLSKRINCEPGYRANVDYHDSHDGTKAITMVVSITD